MHTDQKIYLTCKPRTDRFNVAVDGGEAGTLRMRLRLGGIRRVWAEESPLLI